MYYYKSLVSNDPEHSTFQKFIYEFNDYWILGIRTYLEYQPYIESCMDV